MRRLKTNKVELMVALQDLLQNNSIETQEEIRHLLAKQGVKVNQVKISRLLHKIGAVKLIEGNKTVYRLPGELMTMTPNDSLKHLILNIAHNNSLIVIQAAPGSAQLVARLLDQKKPLGLLGTVAGDDTIFVAPENIKHIQTVYEKITKLLLG